ncbi:hypothetical protein N7520_003043 [Penicillium odoratum]|uniref:uncharacterized protein n=1 Tax=Penicillium odoratum TaxID=1167516 RepID=UPI002547B979|nr:uncharacterized protein N7520_003043 [Penicillium odoratum]KAJ5772514.1 hypothetical protein N7520_003043 [Penicillium odoratum]
MSVNIMNIPRDLQEVFIYIPRVRLMFCTVCEEAVVDKGISYHIHTNDHRDNVPRQMTVGEIMKWFKRHQFRHRTFRSAPRILGEQSRLPGISVVDGFLCKLCEILLSNEKAIRKHCGDQLGWKRNSGADRPWREVWMQQLHQREPNTRWRVPTESPPDTVRDGSGFGSESTGTAQQVCSLPLWQRMLIYPGSHRRRVGGGDS